MIYVFKEVFDCYQGTRYYKKFVVVILRINSKRTQLNILFSITVSVSFKCRSTRSKYKNIINLLCKFDDPKIAQNIIK